MEAAAYTPSPLDPCFPWADEEGAPQLPPAAGARGALVCAVEAGTAPPHGAALARLAAVVLSWARHLHEHALGDGERALGDGERAPGADGAAGEAAPTPAEHPAPGGAEGEGSPAAEEAPDGAAGQAPRAAEVEGWEEDSPTGAGEPPAPDAASASAEDEGGRDLDQRDIELVMSQADVGRAQAAAALRDAGGDIVSAIMHLTEWAPGGNTPRGPSRARLGLLRRSGAGEHSRAPQEYKHTCGAHAAALRQLANLLATIREDGPSAAPISLGTAALAAAATTYSCVALERGVAEVAAFECLAAAFCPEQAAAGREDKPGAAGRALRARPAEPPPGAVGKRGSLTGELGKGRTGWPRGCKGLRNGEYGAVRAPPTPDWSWDGGSPAEERWGGGRRGGWGRPPTPGGDEQEDLPGLPAPAEAERGPLPPCPDGVLTTPPQPPLPHRWGDAVAPSAARSAAHAALSQFAAGVSISGAEWLCHRVALAAEAEDAAAAAPGLAAVAAMPCRSRSLLMELEEHCAARAPSVFLGVVRAHAAADGPSGAIACALRRAQRPPPGFTDPGAVQWSDALRVLATAAQRGTAVLVDALGVPHARGEWGDTAAEAAAQGAASALLAHGPAARTAPAPSARRAEVPDIPIRVDAHMWRELADGDGPICSVRLLQSSVAAHGSGADPAVPDACLALAAAYAQAGSRIPPISAMSALSYVPHPALTRALCADPGRAFVPIDAAVAAGLSHIVSRQDGTLVCSPPPSVVAITAAVAAAGRGEAAECLTEQLWSALRASLRLDDSAAKPLSPRAAAIVLGAELLAARAVAASETPIPEAERCAALRISATANEVAAGCRVVRPDAGAAAVLLCAQGLRITHLAAAGARSLPAPLRPAMRQLLAPPAAAADDWAQCAAPKGPPPVSPLRAALRRRSSGGEEDAEASAAPLTVLQSPLRTAPATAMRRALLSGIGLGSPLSPRPASERGLGGWAATAEVTVGDCAAHELFDDGDQGPPAIPPQHAAPLAAAAARALELSLSLARPLELCTERREAVYALLRAAASCAAACAAAGQAAPGGAPPCVRHLFALGGGPRGCSGEEGDAVARAVAAVRECAGAVAEAAAPARGLAAERTALALGALRGELRRRGEAAARAAAAEAPAAAAAATAAGESPAAPEDGAAPATPPEVTPQANAEAEGSAKRTPLSPPAQPVQSPPTPSRPWARRLSSRSPPASPPVPSHMLRRILRRGSADEDDGGAPGALEVTGPPWMCCSGVYLLRRCERGPYWTADGGDEGAEIRTDSKGHYIVVDASAAGGAAESSAVLRTASPHRGRWPQDLPSGSWREPSDPHSRPAPMTIRSRRRSLGDEAGEAPRGDWARLLALGAGAGKTEVAEAAAAAIAALAPAHTWALEDAAELIGGAGEREMHVLRAACAAGFCVRAGLLCLLLRRTSSQQRGGSSGDFATVATLRSAAGSAAAADWEPALSAATGRLVAPLPAALRPALTHACARLCARPGQHAPTLSAALALHAALELLAAVVPEPEGEQAGGSGLAEGLLRQLRDGLTAAAHGCFTAFPPRIGGGVKGSASVAAAARRVLLQCGAGDNDTLHAWTTARAREVVRGALSQCQLPGPVDASVIEGALLSVMQRAVGDPSTLLPGAGEGAADGFEREQQGRRAAGAPSGALAVLGRTDSAKALQQSATERGAVVPVEQSCLQLLPLLPAEGHSAAAAQYILQFLTAAAEAGPQNAARQRGALGMLCAVGGGSAVRELARAHAREEGADGDSRGGDRGLLRRWLSAVLADAPELARRVAGALSAGLSQAAAGSWPTADPAGYMALCAVATASGGESDLVKQAVDCLGETAARQLADGPGGGWCRGSLSLLGLLRSALAGALPADSAGWGPGAVGALREALLGLKWLHGAVRGGSAGGCTFARSGKDFVHQHWYLCHTAYPQERQGVCSWCAENVHRRAGYDVTYSGKIPAYCDTQGRLPPPDPTGTPPGPPAAPLTPAEVTDPFSTALCHAPPAPPCAPVPLPAGFWVDCAAVRAALQQLAGLLRTMLAHAAPAAAAAVGALQDSPEGGRARSAPRGAAESVLASGTWTANETTREPLCTSPDRVTVCEGAVEGRGEHEPGYDSALFQAARPGPRQTCAASPAGWVALLDRAQTVLLVDEARSFPVSGGPARRERGELSVTAKVQLPFKAAGMAVHPGNGSYLVVYGVYSVQVLVVVGGNVTSRVSPHLALSASARGAHVVQCLWVPGSDTELAVVTNKFIKVYDLGADIYCPTHNYVIEEGDFCGAAFADGPSGGSAAEGAGCTSVLLAQTSGGELWCTPVTPGDSKSGPLELTRQLRTGSAARRGGGCGVHYSSLLRAVLLSFSSGMTLCMQWDAEQMEAREVLVLPNACDSSTPWAVSAWAESADAPGLILCLMNGGSQLGALHFSPARAAIAAQSVDPPGSGALAEGVAVLRRRGGGPRVLAVTDAGNVCVYRAVADLPLLHSVLSPDQASEVARLRRAVISAKPVQRPRSRRVSSRTLNGGASRAEGGDEAAPAESSASPEPAEEAAAAQLHGRPLPCKGAPFESIPPDTREAMRRFDLQWGGPQYTVPLNVWEDLVLLPRSRWTISHGFGVTPDDKDRLADGKPPVSVLPVAAPAGRSRVDRPELSPPAPGLSPPAVHSPAGTPPRGGSTSVSPARPPGAGSTPPQLALGEDARPSARFVVTQVQSRGEGGDTSSGQLAAVRLRISCSALPPKEEKGASSDSAGTPSSPPADAGAEAAGAPAAVATLRVMGQRAQLHPSGAPRWVNIALTAEESARAQSGGIEISISTTRLSVQLHRLDVFSCAAAAAQRAARLESAAADAAADRAARQPRSVASLRNALGGDRALSPLSSASSALDAILQRLMLASAGERGGRTALSPTSIARVATSGGSYPPPSTRPSGDSAGEARPSERQSTLRSMLPPLPSSRRAEGSARGSAPAPSAPPPRVPLLRAEKRPGPRASAPPPPGQAADAKPAGPPAAHAAFVAAADTLRLALEALATGGDDGAAAAAAPLGEAELEHAAALWQVVVHAANISNGRLGGAEREELAAVQALSALHLLFAEAGWNFGRMRGRRAAALLLLLRRRLDAPPSDGAHGRLVAAAGAAAADCRGVAAAFLGERPAVAAVLLRSAQSAFSAAEEGTTPAWLLLGWCRIVVAAIGSEAQPAALEGVLAALTAPAESLRLQALRALCEALCGGGAELPDAATVRALRFLAARRAPAVGATEMCAQRAVAYHAAVTALAQRAPPAAPDAAEVSAEVLRALLGLQGGDDAPGLTLLAPLAEAGTPADLAYLGLRSAAVLLGAGLAPDCGNALTLAARSRKRDKRKSREAERQGEGPAEGSADGGERSEEQRRGLAAAALGAVLRPQDQAALRNIVVLLVTAHARSLSPDPASGGELALLPAAPPPLPQRQGADEEDEAAPAQGVQAPGEPCPAALFERAAAPRPEPPLAPLYSALADTRGGSGAGGGAGGGELQRRYNRDLLVCALQCAGSLHAAGRLQGAEDWKEAIDRCLLCDQLRPLRQELKRLLMLLCGSGDAYHSFRDTATMRRESAALCERLPAAAAGTAAQDAFAAHSSLVALAKVAVRRGGSWADHAARDSKIVPLLVTWVDDGGVHAASAAHMLRLLSVILSRPDHAPAAAAQITSPDFMRRVARVFVSSGLLDTPAMGPCVPAQKQSPDADPVLGLTPRDPVISLRAEALMLLRAAYTAAPTPAPAHSPVTDGAESDLPGGVPSGRSTPSASVQSEAEQGPSEARAPPPAEAGNPTAAEVVLAAVLDVLPGAESYSPRDTELLLAVLLGAVKVVAAQGGPRQPFSRVAAAVGTAAQRALRNLVAHPRGAVYEGLEAAAGELRGSLLEGGWVYSGAVPRERMVDAPLSTLHAECKYSVDTIFVRPHSGLWVKRVSLQLSEMRMSHVPRVVEVYMHPRTVPSARALRDADLPWQLLGTVQIERHSPNARACLELPLCTFAHALRFRFAEFHPDPNPGVPETLICPSCCQVITNRHGQCLSCDAENAYQCRQCRSINHERLDAFLCHECGWCRYGRAEVALQCRSALAPGDLSADRDRERATELLKQHCTRADELGRQLRELRERAQRCTTRLALQPALGPQARAAPAPAGAGATSGSPRPGGRQGAVQRSGPQVEPAAAEQPATAPLHSLYFGPARDLDAQLTRLLRKQSALRSSLQAYAGSVRATTLVRRGSPARSRGGEGEDARAAAHGVGHFDSYGLLALALTEAARALAATDGELASGLASAVGLDTLYTAAVRGPARVRTAARRLLVELQTNREVTQEVLGMTEAHCLQCLESRPGVANAATLHSAVLVLAESCKRSDGLRHLRLPPLLRFFLLCCNGACDRPQLLESAALPVLAVAAEVLLRDGAGSAGEGAEKLPAAVRRCALRWITVWLLRRDAQLSMLASRDWLPALLLTPGAASFAPQFISVIDGLCGSDPRPRSGLLRLLVTNLPAAAEICRSCSGGAAYFQLLFALLRARWARAMLVLKGFLSFLCKLIAREVDAIAVIERAAHPASAAATPTELGWGALRVLQLLGSFMLPPDKTQGDDAVEPLPGCAAVLKRGGGVTVLLHSQLSLRSIVATRTAQVGEAEALLQRLLGALMGQTDEDRRSLTKALVLHLAQPRLPLALGHHIIQEVLKAVDPTPPEPVYRLLIKKKPSQEDFIRGNLPRTPIPSTAVGKRMSDVMRYVYRELELDADFPLELLVDNKIINAELPIALVHEQVWCSGGTGRGADSPMLIVFRLQGLDGEATEETVDTLEEPDKEEEDPAKTFAVTSCLAEDDADGLAVLIAYVSAVAELMGTRAATEQDVKLLRDALHLLQHCCHLAANRRALAEHHALPVLLGALPSCAGNPAAAEEVLPALLSVAGRVAGEGLAEDGGDAEEISNVAHLGSCLEHVAAMSQHGDRALRGAVVSHARRGRKGLPAQEAHLYDVLRLAAAVAGGGASGAAGLFDFFAPHIERLSEGTEAAQRSDAAFHTACLAAVMHDLSEGAGGELKTRLQEAGAPARACALVTAVAPSAGDAEVDEARYSALVSALRLLESTAACPGAVPGSVRESVAGSLESLHAIECATAQNWEEAAAAAAAALDGLQQAGTAPGVSELREATKKAKQGAAMAQREKVLRAMNLQDGAGPELDLDSLEDEEGLACLVCREGAALRPQDVLGLYVYVRRVEIVTNVFQQSGAGGKGYSLAALSPPQRVLTYSCVTHFNAIHFTCHRNAVLVDSSARPPKSEWQGATERNLKTLCNAQLPLRPPTGGGADDPEQYRRLLTAWSERAATRRGQGLLSAFEQSVYDLRMLLSRAVWGHSYAADSNGGGTEHNFCAVPFFLQASLSLMHRGDHDARHDEAQRAAQLLTQFLTGHATPALFSLDAASPPALTAEQVFYLVTLTLHTMSLAQWQRRKYALTRSLVAFLVSAHAARGRKAKPLNMVFADLTPPPVPSGGPVLSHSGGVGLPDREHYDPHGDEDDLDDDYEHGEEHGGWAVVSGGFGAAVQRHTSPAPAAAAAAEGPIPDVSTPEGVLALLQGPLRFLCLLDLVQSALKEGCDDPEPDAESAAAADTEQVTALRGAAWLCKLRNRLETEQQEVVEGMRKVQEQMSSEIMQIDSVQEFFDVLDILPQVLEDAGGPEEWVRQFFR